MRDNKFTSYLIKNIWIIIPIFFMLIFFKTFPFFTYIAGGDSFPIFYTTDFIYQQFGVWASSVSYGAVIGQANYILFLPIVFLIDLLKVIFGDFLAQYIYFASIFTLTPLGVYLLLRSFKFSKSTSLIGGFFYGFHFLVWSGLTRNVIPITNLFLFTPYIIALVNYFLDTNKNKYLLLLLIIGLLNAPIISNPWTFIVQVFSIFIFLLRYGNIKKIIIALSFVYFFCIAGVVVLFIMFFNSYNLVNDEWNNTILKGGAIAREASNSILSNSLRGFNGDLFGGWGYVNAYKDNKIYYPFPYNDTYKTLLFTIISFIPLLLIILSNIFFKNKKMFYWTCIFLSSLFLFKSIAPPFGGAFEYCLNHIPLCSIFRAPHQKIALLFLLSIIMIISNFRENLKGQQKIALDLVVGIYIVIMGSFLFFYPYISRMNMVENIPSSYKESSILINDNQDIKNILILPYNDSTWINTEFGYEGYPLHSYLLPKKQIYGRNDLSFSTYAKNLFEIVGPALKNRDHEILKLLEKYNVDTIIYDGYTDRYSRFLVKEEHEKNINWLDNLNGLQKIGNFGKIHVYHKESIPLILGKNQIYKKVNPTHYKLGITLGDKKTLTFLQSFHPDWKLYLEPYSKLNCDKQIKYIGNYNNQDYSVIECESENKFIVGGEITKLWKKPIFDESHKIIFDYANSWILNSEYIKNNYPKEYYKQNSDGSIDLKVSLYFKPQSYFYLGLIVSIIVFFFLILYLIYSEINYKKNKK